MTGEKLSNQTEEQCALDERRKSQRRPIYIGEGFRVEVRSLPNISLFDSPTASRFSDFQIDGELIDLSPNGLGVAVDIGDIKLAETGQVFSIRSKTQGDEYFECKVILVHMSKKLLGQNEKLRLGFCYLEDEQRHDRERRKSNRFETSSEMPPQAFCSQTIFFQEFMHFQICEISTEGARLETRTHKVNVIPSVTLTFNIFIPTEGQHNVRARVVSVKSDNLQNQYELRLEWQEPPRSFIKALGRYLFFYALARPDELREAGFGAVVTEKALRVDHPLTTKDWDHILLLRLKAYQAVGKFKTISDPREMLDQFDPFSRQIICRAGENTVGVSRIVFVDKKRERSEHENIGVKVPDWLWDNGFVEVSRTCTDSNYRGGAVFITLLRHIARIVLESGHRYVVANCNSDMLPVYQRAGFKKLGIEFEAFGKKDCQLILMDVRRVLDGRDIGFLPFNIMALPISSFLARRGFFNRIGFGFYLKIHEFLNPYILQLFEWLKSKKKSLRKKMKQGS